MRLAAALLALCISSPAFADGAALPDYADPLHADPKCVSKTLSQECLQEEVTVRTGWGTFPPDARSYCIGIANRQHDVSTNAALTECLAAIMDARSK
jgi:hypothetical protein